MNTLTSTEYARRIGASPRYIRKLAKDGRIDGAQKRGRDWHIPEDALCQRLPPGRPRRPPERP